jgi:putative ABC transport system ATP-binding protein
MTPGHLIHSENLSFGYSDSPPLYSGASFSVRPGAFYLVRGPSGSGKSSLLRLMNRLEEPTEGALYLKGEPYDNIPAPDLRRQILYIQQTPTVTDGSVKDNLLMPFSFKNNRSLTKPEDHRLRKLLDDFSLDKIDLDKPARALSVGQQQRLCLIRGLLLSPSVILLDEPTSALDDESSHIVENMAEALCIDQGKAIVLVSHREFKPRRVRPVVIHVENGILSILNEA